MRVEQIEVEQLMQTAGTLQANVRAAQQRFVLKQKAMKCETPEIVLRYCEIVYLWSLEHHFDSANNSLVLDDEVAGLVAHEARLDASSFFTHFGWMPQILGNLFLLWLFSRDI